MSLVRGQLLKRIKCSFHLLPKDNINASLDETHRIGVAEIQAYHIRSSGVLPELVEQTFVYFQASRNDFC